MTASVQQPELTLTHLEGLRPTSSHGFTPGDERELMRGIYARGDRLMFWFLVSHTVLALALALFHGTWLATLAVSGAALGSFTLSAWLLPRTFFTRAYAGVAQQAFVALHIYQLYGQSEQHFWYFTAFTMMIVYQDWVCMWPGAILIIFQHTLFAALHNAGMPVHFFPEAHVGFSKLFFHFGIALVHVALCGYWALLLRKQTLGDAWQKLLLSQDQRLLEAQLVRLKQSELALVESSQALVESFRQQRAILDNSSDAMWIKDIDGQYIAVNAAFARFVGLPMADIEGKTDDHLLSADEVERMHAQEREVENAREPRTLEHELVLDGIRRVMETAVTPIFDAHDVSWGRRERRATSRSASVRRVNGATPKRGANRFRSWRVSVCSPEASRTISTTCLPSSSVMPNSRDRSCRRDHPRRRPLRRSSSRQFAPPSSRDRCWRTPVRDASKSSPSM
ncbi:MAG: PAS domain-containing protein [Gemmatimonadota bacterium]